MSEDERQAVFDATAIARSRGDANPRADARELCRRAQATENRIHLRPVDQELGWGPRRMNAAIAYLKSNRLADDYGGMMNGEYLNHDVTLTASPRR